ncbi:Qat anti-phage system TatD family nuclease QatD [Blautia wexlerae]|uniref:Qat anti-phage system TatD family nuclease QatD n=1 Tax=Blautia wexlerae TaxID=418240 RepID=UPI0018A009F4|nr:Qat anti-phage system TatD family nuclease QatD [Blautia wexlerae]
MMIYDTHCHLDLIENMPQIIREIENDQIGIFAVGTTPKAYQKEIKLCENCRNIHVGLGLHPQLVASGYDDMALFEILIEKSFYVGEVGLDFTREYIKTKELQIKIFQKIIDLCEEYGEKIISIHSLKSAGCVLDILQDSQKRKNNIYILHWFTGTMGELKRAVEMGCYFSINPRMFKTKSGIEIIKRIPIERVVLESDAPFTMPLNHSSELKKVLNKEIETISSIVGYDVLNIVSNNQKNIFKN